MHRLVIVRPDPARDLARQDRARTLHMHQRAGKVARLDLVRQQAIDAIGHVRHQQEWSNRGL